MPNADLAVRWRRRARLLAWRCRYVLVALCCSVAALAGVDAVRPADPATVPVVVTTRTVEAGQILASRDVAVRRLPREGAPAGALTSSAQAVGQAVAVRIPARTPLAPGIVVVEGHSAPPGRVLAPIRLDAAVAALLGPGARVDVLAPADLPTGAVAEADGGPRSAPYLARSALVMSSPRAEEPIGDERVVLVAVTPEEGVALARAGHAILATVLVS